MGNGDESVEGGGRAPRSQSGGQTGPGVGETGGETQPGAQNGVETQPGNQNGEGMTGSGMNGTAPRADTTRRTELTITYNDSGEKELLFSNNKRGYILQYPDSSLDTVKAGVRHFTPKQFKFRIKTLQGTDTLSISMTPK